MMNKKIAVAVAVVFAVVCLAEAREENPHDMADALRLLQELDHLYTQAARPRIDRRDVGSVDPDLLDRAVRLLQLQKLDRIYSYHTRPRFGKRSDSFMNWAKDLESSRNICVRANERFGRYTTRSQAAKPDIPAWLAYARRR